MSTTETKINIRVDKKTKDKAQKTLEELGLDLSSGVKLFLHSVINTQSIPFDVRTKNGYTQNEELRILKEAEEALKSSERKGKNAFVSAKDLHKSLI